MSITFSQMSPTNIDEEEQIEPNASTEEDDGQILACGVFI
jgi:hypothetical protein